MTPSSRFRPCVAVHGNYKEISHAHEVITFFPDTFLQRFFQKCEAYTLLGACMQLANVITGVNEKSLMSSLTPLRRVNGGARAPPFVDLPPQWQSRRVAVCGKKRLLALQRFPNMVFIVKTSPLYTPFE